MRDLLPDLRTTAHALALTVVVLIAAIALAVQLHKLDVAITGLGQ